jgi:diaminopimelate epimerase
LELNILNKKIIGEVTNDNYVSIKYYINTKIKSLIIDNNIISFNGISLIFSDDKENEKLLKKINDKNIKNIIKKRIKKTNIVDKAIGIVLVDDNKIYPFIWVKDIDTLYFETACGSASIAYALLQFQKTKKINYNVKQPSGYEFEIEIKTKKDKIDYILFKGIVEEYK